MTELTPEMEKRLLEMLPLVVRWIKKNKKLKDTELQAFYKIYSDIYEFAKDMTYEETMQFNKKYENDSRYGEHLKVLLSPKGREYVKYLLQIGRQWKPKFVEFSQLDE